MGAKPSTQQPLRPRSDTFPHGNSTSPGPSSYHPSNGQTNNGNLFSGPTSILRNGSSSGTRSRGASPGSVEAASSAAARRLRSMSAVEQPQSSLSNRRTAMSASDSDDSSPETNDNYAVLRIPGSLPLRLFQLSGFKCPVCNKKVASDNVELHLVECLTKPRIIYNEDVITENKGECVVCLEEMESGHTIARLPCLCVYHKRCIDSWFKVNRSCPEHPGD